MGGGTKNSAIFIASEAICGAMVILGSGGWAQYYFVALSQVFISFFEFCIMHAAALEISEYHPSEGRRSQRCLRLVESKVLNDSPVPRLRKQNFMVSSVIVITGLCCLLALVYTTRFSAITFHNNTYTDLRQLNLSSGVGEKLASTLHKKHQFISERIRRTNHKSNADLLARVIIKESAIAGYDPFLVTSIIFSESTFRPKVVSHKGAIGLMQLLPTTAEYIAKKEGVAWRGTGSLYEAEYNVRLGIRYIQYLENMFNGDTRKALMAYNWGPGNVRKSLRKKSAVIPQVQQYANKILSRKQQMQNVYFNSNRA